MLLSDLSNCLVVYLGVPVCFWFDLLLFLKSAL